MKRVLEALVCFAFIVAFAGVADAGYSCDDGGSLEKKSKNIEENDVKVVNGIGIVVRQVDEAAAINRIFAELVIDADKKTIINDTTSAQISLLSGNRTAKFFNAEGNYASITIDSSTKRIKTDEWETIGEFEVLLLKLDFNGGVASAEIIAGVKEMSLSNEKRGEIIEIASEKYLIELVSGSDDDATISVGKCESGNLIGIVESVPNEPANETGNEENENETEPAEQTIIESKPENGAGGAEVSVAKRGFFQRIKEWFASLFRK